MNKTKLLFKATQYQDNCHNIENKEQRCYHKSNLIKKSANKSKLILKIIIGILIQTIYKISLIIHQTIILTCKISKIPKLKYLPIKK